MRDARGNEQLGERSLPGRRLPSIVDAAGEPEATNAWPESRPGVCPLPTRRGGSVRRPWMPAGPRAAADAPPGEHPAATAA
jgi:hypothetical protein